MADHQQLVESWIDDFRAAYRADSRNASRQSFDQDRDWVRVFLLEGGAGQRGWLAQSEDMLRHVRSVDVAGTLERRLREIGRAAAAEWAKDSRTRRVHSTGFQGSPNLVAWSRQLQRAAERESGDGATITRTLEMIEDELRSAMTPPEARP